MALQTKEIYIKRLNELETQTAHSEIENLKSEHEFVRNQLKAKEE